MNTPARPLALLTRTTAVALCAIAALALSATAAHADTPEQPALTSRDHAIIDVPGLVNARELGAFTGIDGQAVDAPRLIRSESLDKISAAGAQTLADTYHVDLVIDLRTPTQVAAKPDVAIPGAKNVNISMFGADGDYSDDTAMYHDLVDKGYVDQATPGPMISAYRQILQLLAGHTTGTVLIHCSHGMDRTGTVIDLLDQILGVSASDILHDYLLSNTQLGVTWATPALLQGTFEGDIAQKYAGMDAYLSTTVGVTAQEKAALRARFLVSNDANAQAITVGGVAVSLDDASAAAGASAVLARAVVTPADVQVTTDDPGATTAVTVDGQNVTVTVTAEDGTTTRQYRITVAKPALGLAQVGDIAAGSTITVTGSGFTPGAVYDVVVHSTPAVIGQATAAADGTVTATGTIPSDLAPGAHTVFLADGSGNPVTDPLAFTVTATATAGAATAALAGPSVATGGTLIVQEQDGSMIAWAAFGAVMLLAAVAGTVAMRRGIWR